MEPEGLNNPYPFQVDYLEIVPDTERYPVAVATAGDLVYLLKADDSARTLHHVYGQPVTCLDVSANQAAFGVKSLGWVHEGNKVQNRTSVFIF